MNDAETIQDLLQESHDSHNPGPEGLRDIMDRVKTIAVVGMSTNPEKPARRIPAYLASRGYDIIPVNPTADQILGKPTRASLAEVTEPVDMVLVFRPSAEAGQVLAQAVQRPEDPVVWLQEGIMDPPAAEAAREDGHTVVQDLCTYRVHKALARERDA